MVNTTIPQYIERNGADLRGSLTGDALVALSRTSGQIVYDNAILDPGIRDAIRSLLAYAFMVGVAARRLGILPSATSEGFTMGESDPANEIAATAIQILRVAGIGGEAAYQRCLGASVFMAILGASSASPLLKGGTVGQRGANVGVIRKSALVFRVAGA